MKYRDIHMEFDNISYSSLASDGISGEIEMNDKRISKLESVVSFLLTKLEDTKFNSTILKSSQQGTYNE